MQPITNLLINSLRKAAKFLHRDFLELEMLQKNPIRNEEFCRKSYLRLRALLNDELQKYAEHLFFPEDQFDLDNKDNVILINPLDSLNNFARGIPFFSVAATYLKKDKDGLIATNTVIYMPALNEIYYAEKGKGAFADRGNLNSNYQSVRLRVSDNSELQNCLAIIENSNDPIYEDINYIRSFGSACYAATLLASGKADFVCLPSLNFTLSHSFELLVKEAGGIIINSDDKFIYSNRYIAKQLKKC
ncbi:MAG TPA: inositol monophosphatase [Rickettsia endosymbiont of Pyrocoelia pectoralis]|nr:inositol monophosphatase [Rickettsia endosymbiont of Pyrocoelia pectoralis]